MKMTPIEAAYESTRPRIPGVSFDAFCEAVKDCEVNPVVLDGEVVGAMLVRGDEIHAAVMPSAKGRWFRKGQMKVLNDVILKHGHAVTQATTEQGREFVERLGFVWTGKNYRKEVSYGR